MLNFNAPTSVAASCPSFRLAGTSAGSLAIREVDFPSPQEGYPSSLLRLVVAVSYPQGGNFPVPSKKYFLMDAEFNEADGVSGSTAPDLSTCGGLEATMCFHLVRATYNPTLDQYGDGGPETSFNLPDPSATFATVNGDGGASCLATPTHPATWGAVKAQYHN